jgi:hypothetical protein
VAGPTERAPDRPRAAEIQTSRRGRELVARKTGSYKFEKRRREVEKQQKKADKRARRIEKKEGDAGPSEPEE